MTYSEKVTGHGGGPRLLTGQGEWLHERGTSEGNHDLETGPTLVQLCLGHSSCPTKAQGGQGSWKEGYSLCGPWPHCAQGILSRWHLGTCLYHMEGHLIPLFGTINIHGKADIWGHCMWVHVLVWASTRLPIAHLHCTDCHVWRVTT